MAANPSRPVGGLPAAPASGLVAVPRGSARPEVLTFLIGEEEYGIETGRVREIVKAVRLTSVPRVPPFILGIMMFRGTIVPIFDLRLRFGLSPSRFDPDSRFIILDVEADGERGLGGMLVDRVEGVAEIGPSIEPVPMTITGRPAGFLLGVARRSVEKSGERLVILIDPDALLRVF